MDKIICLVGESGSGKSTIAELLEKEGYNYIQSYTNRPKRFDNEKGHIFVSAPEIFNNGDAISEDIIAYTFFDGYHYWATKQQYEGKGISIYVVDVEGIKNLRRKIKNVEIIVIYLKAETRIRAKRMYERKHNLSHSTLSETLGQLPPIDEDIYRRLEHDRTAFRCVPCDYAIDANRDIEAVLRDVNEIIKGRT